MDYFSAMLSILVTILFSLHRICNIVVGSAASVLLFAVLAIFYTFHVCYLSFYKFDYGYNMKASVGLGLVHSIIWLIWVGFNYSRRDYAWKQARIVILLASSMSLELLDFPPIFGLLDAHSLWHMATIPIVRMHWNFSIEDALYEINNDNLAPRRSTRNKKYTN